MSVRKSEVNKKPLPDAHFGVVELLQRFAEANVRYCHFKSNEHVAEGICGVGDLDILIDRSAHDKAQACLLKSGFKLFPSHPLAGYPAVEDWIGMDPHTGELAHCHVHWQMIAGERHLKSYRIPWEQRILNHRVLDENLGIYTSSHEAELLLLIARAITKFRWREYVKLLLGRSVMDAGMEKERKWLLERVDVEQLKNLASEFLPRPLGEQLVSVATRPSISTRQFLAARKALKRHLAHWRAFGPLHARTLRWLREGRKRFGVKLLKKSGRFPLSRMTPATGGIVIALIGADGAGKTTQTKDLAHWLAWKLDVTRVYFGKGDGRRSWHRSVLVWLRSCTRPKRHNNAATGQAVPTQPGIPDAQRSALQNLRKGIYGISVALEKRSTLRRVSRARNRGMIVVTDRYPQTRVHNYADGPILADWVERSGIWKFFGLWERQLLSPFSAVMPDLVLRLNISEATAAARKADTPREKISRKIEVARTINFGAECRAVELDAEQQLDSVTRAVRTHVWQQL